MGYMYLENLKRIGRVDSDGYIYSENYDRVGKIETDGRIYGENLSYIGRIDSDGYIYLSNMKRIGRIHRDGYVYDELFNRVGRLDSDIVDYIFGSTAASTQSNIPPISPSAYSESSSGLSVGQNLLVELIVRGITIIVVILLLYSCSNAVVDFNQQDSTNKSNIADNSVTDMNDPMAPVALRTLNAYVGELYPTTAQPRTVEDNMGNIYPEAFYSYATEHSAIYDIGKKYDVLKGTVAVGKPMTTGETFTGEIRVYGDGQLLWSDNSINTATKPYEMSVSISGITDLEIVIDSNGPGPVIFANVELQKTTVSNTSIEDKKNNSENTVDTADEGVSGVALRTLDAYEGKLHPTGVWIEDKEDNMGNIYSEAFYSYADEHSAIYDIGKKYDVLKGTVAVGKPMTTGETFTGEIRVYGDGQLLWSDNSINTATKPYEMSVSISGITDLEIVVDSNGPGPVIFANVMLQKNN